ncbi:MAG: DUF1573 domain-containing protein [Gemmataceae bacterium]|nr:DUF1573 domain-containing protein [Gemmataceae bacterium]
MFRSAVAAAGVLLTVVPAWAGPADLFAEKVKDFGTTPRGPVLVHYFRFTNTTGQPLTLGQPRVSCGCVSAAVSKNQVAPGETAAVIAHMDTRRIQTPNTTKSVTIYVPFLAPAHEEVSLRVQTVCRDDLVMAPDTLAFGTVRKGQGGTATTKVTFTSDPNWKVTEAASTGGYVKAEVKEESRAGAVVTYAVTATLDKDCPAGNWTADIVLKTSNPAVASLRVPVTVTVTVAAAASVAATPEAVQFGDVPMGTPAEKRVVLKGGSPFKILEIKGADDQLGVKVADKDEAKAEHVITLSASPKAAGGFVRSVEIVTDNKDQPKVVIPVAAKVTGGK